MRDQESDTGAGREGRAASMKKISVIIPAYNSEKYIEQCLWSVTGQTYGNLEIIVVDDGSGDDSAAICGRLAETDGRIRVLRQKNSGVSAARNHGIDAATGEYVFFLDSDDAIHPLLLEEMLRQAEQYHAQLAFCGYRKLDSSRLEAVLGEVSGLPETEAPGAALGEELPGSTWETCQGEELLEGTQETAQGAVSEKYTDGRWLTADETETEEWFHVKYTDTLSGIGGKLILREAVGKLRFDSRLVNGEDTFFLYQLTRSRVRSVYCQEEWYYYRKHGESVTSSAGTAGSMRYFESAVRIRNGEYENGNAEHAMRWEILVVDQVRRSYGAQKRGKAGSVGITGSARQELRKIAVAEMRHPLFRRICFSDRVLFTCCFACYPVYVVLNRIVLFLANRRSR
ncbi:MAG TPA: hypothetical protein DCZ91_01295 [Lachnospiraceae bacterium]|nr:hypothetical protein [Lachnospiraceae bacterium]